MPVVLASASVVRLEMLRAAGVACDAESAGIDETALKRVWRAQGAGIVEIAQALAEEKARRTARRHPGALVLGADQMLRFDAESLDKPVDRAEARRHLMLLRGHRHSLVSAVVAIRDGQRLWRHVVEVHLTMRQFSDAFLDAYLNQAGDAVLSSVGAYQLEGLGAQLFSAIEGDYFAVLGLPLLPTLDFLRGEGVLAT